MTEQTTSIRLRVSPQVARIVTREAPRDLRLMAARGAVPLSGHDLLTALFYLYHSGDAEIRTRVQETICGLPAGILVPVVGQADLHPHLLDFVARFRFRDPAVMEPLVLNPATATATLVRLAAAAEPAVLDLIACNDRRLAEAPEIGQAIIANPQAERALKYRFGWVDPEERAAASAAAPEEEPAAAGEGGDPEAEEEAEPEGGSVTIDETVDDPEPEEEGDPEAEEMGEVEEMNLSKYQQSLQMEVSDKIKIAMTGDKEWRNIFIKDANKLVSSAVMKNPRITDGEVLAIAKNRTSSEELIRLITINREWLKSYEIKKALVMHPKTPLPKALRFMSILIEKDLKNLGKSRNVSQVIVNNARRMLMAKGKK